MDILKVVKIGDSLGPVLPKSAGLSLDDELIYTHKGHKHILEHSSKPIVDFEKEMLIKEEVLHNEFKDGSWR